MTAYTKTISVSLLLFGPEPTEKWSTTGTTAQALIWGTDKWGYGTVGLPIVLYKSITNTLPIATNQYKNFTKYFDNQQTLKSEILGRRFSKGIFNDLANTTAVGKNILHFYSNDLANTTSVGKEISRFYSNSLNLSEDLTTEATYYRTITNSFQITSTNDPYAYRDDYAIIVGGASSVLSYPRTVFNTVYSSSSGWSYLTGSSAVWS